MKKDIIIIGAGGHGKVVAFTAVAAGMKVVGFLDDGLAAGAKVTADLTCLGKASETYIGHSEATFVVALGNNDVRKTLFELHARDRKAATVIHPSVILFPEVTVSEGTVVLARATLMNGVSVGRNSIVNAGVIVDHDSKVGDHVHLSPGCIIGSNSVVSSGRTLAPGTILAPGSKE